MTSPASGPQLRLNIDRCIALMFVVAVLSAAILDNNFLAGVVGVLGGLNWWVRA